MRMAFSTSFVPRHSPLPKCCGSKRLTSKYFGAPQITRRQGSRQVTRMGLFGLGLPEVVVIAGVAALLFGPSKLPEIGKGLGKTMKSFQVAAKEFETELKTEMEEDPEGNSEEKVKAAEEKVEVAKEKK